MARELDCQCAAPLSLGSSCRLRRATVRSMAALLLRRTTFRRFATRSSSSCADADDLDEARSESPEEPDDDEVEYDAEVPEDKDRREEGMAAARKSFAQESFERRATRTRRACSASAGGDRLTSF